MTYGHSVDDYRVDTLSNFTEITIPSLNNEQTDGPTIIIEKLSIRKIINLKYLYLHRIFRKQR